MDDSPGGSRKGSQDVFKAFLKIKPLTTSAKPGTAAKPISMATAEAFPTKPEEQGRPRFRSANYKGKSASPGSTVRTNLSLPLDTKFQRNGFYVQSNTFWTEVERKQLKSFHNTSLLENPAKRFRGL